MYRDQLDEKQYLLNTWSLYYLTLGMLDKLDRWEDYLRVFAGVLADTRVGRMPSLPEHRKRVVERKIKRKRSGMKLGNVMHARQEDLSPSEIQDRRRRILRMFGELNHMKREKPTTE
jgi:hypothetical protein